MSNIRTVAKKAGVSIATVSRALDPQKSFLVHPKTREKIKQITRNQRFVPNKAARALSKNASDTIGMVTAFSSDIVKSPYYEGLISGVIEGVHPLRYDLKWILVRPEEIETCRLEDLLHEHFVDGLIFLTWRLFPALVREVESTANVPAVLINDYEKKIKCSIVHGDNDDGVRQLLLHLKSKGYKKFGMLRGPEYMSLDAKERYAAFRKYTRQMRILVKESHVFQSDRFEAEFGYQKMLEWIRTKNIPDVIFAANDELADGAIRALQSKKIRIPEDVAIAGYDGSPAKRAGYPLLTTVKQPLEVMGRAAVETLDKLIQKKVKAPVQLKFSPELVPGESA